MIHELNQASLKFGLKVNLKKTNVMDNNNYFAEDTDEPTNIDNNEIEEVYHYIYLVSPLEGNFRQSEYDLQNKDIPIKPHVYDQCILPTLTYTDQKPGILRNNKP